MNHNEILHNISVRSTMYPAINYLDIQNVRNSWLFRLTSVIM